MRRIILAALAAVAFIGAGAAYAQAPTAFVPLALCKSNQTCPPTARPGQTFGLEPGDTLQELASTAAAASANIPVGTAPSAPNVGDEWLTTAGFCIQTSSGPACITSSPTLPSTVLQAPSLPVSALLCAESANTTSNSVMWQPCAGLPSGTPNQVLATAPSGSGSTAASLRALVAADLPLATSTAPGAVEPGPGCTVTAGAISCVNSGSSITKIAAGSNVTVSPSPCTSGTCTISATASGGTTTVTNNGLAPSAGQVPVYTGTGNQTAPGTPSGGGSGALVKICTVTLTTEFTSTLALNSANGCSISGFNTYEVSFNIGTNSSCCEESTNLVMTFKGGASVPGITLAPSAVGSQPVAGRLVLVGLTNTNSSGTDFATVSGFSFADPALFGNTGSTATTINTGFGLASSAINEIDFNLGVTTNDLEGTATLWGLSS
jgi:hypothetical protein